MSESESENQDQSQSQEDQHEAGSLDRPEGAPAPQPFQYLRYLGGGAFIGVPARDLSLAEVDALGLDKDALLGSGHYALEELKEEIPG